jgi:hypothetical protein
VDDMLSGSETMEGVIGIFNGVIQNPSQINVKMFQMTYNDRTVEDNIPVDKLIQMTFSKDDDDPQIKKVGLRCHKKADSFSFKALTIL